METVFHSRETKMLKSDLEPPSTMGQYHGYLRVTFVRDPVSRFFSSYEEMFVRVLFDVEKKHTITTPEAFAFLMDGLQTYKDYEAVFCPPALQPNRPECKQWPSHENGTLAARFDKFLHLWDGTNPFDVHLKLQAPMLSDANTGLPFPVDLIYNTTDATGGWRQVAALKHLPYPSSIPRARGYPRRLNVSKVSDESRLLICQIVAIDNCCFNLALPAVCAHNDAANAFCALEQRPDGDHRVTAWEAIGHSL